jgi:hypothetical protein
MKDEIIESIFGCLERIEDKLDKQSVQSEQEGQRLMRESDSIRKKLK